MRFAASMPLGWSVDLCTHCTHMLIVLCRLDAVIRLKPEPLLAIARRESAIAQETTMAGTGRKWDRVTVMRLQLKNWIRYRCQQL